MAEFTEVMRQAKRMCADSSGICNYSNCPLDNGKECRLNIELDGEDYNELERIIMDWAAEHPEPVYPNWEDGWRQIFPDAKYTPCPGSFGVKYSVPDCVYRACTDCKSSHIPAEVAEKLGIKPVTAHSVKHYCENCKYAKRKSTAEPCVRCNHCIDCEESILTTPDLWEARNENTGRDQED